MTDYDLLRLEIMRCYNHADDNQLNFALKARHWLEIVFALEILSCINSGTNLKGLHDDKPDNQQNQRSYRQARR